MGHQHQEQQQQLTWGTVPWFGGHCITRYQPGPCHLRRHNPVQPGNVWREKYFFYRKILTIQFQTESLIIFPKADTLATKFVCKQHKWFANSFWCLTICPHPCIHNYPVSIVTSNFSVNEKIPRLKPNLSGRQHTTQQLCCRDAPTFSPLLSFLYMLVI